jgi:DNA-binding protein HU-beta
MITGKTSITFGGKMNKGDMIQEVAEILGSKKDAKQVVDHVFDSIKTALKNGDSVQVLGFGTFKVQKTKARQGRNPQTGEAIQIAAKNVPKFVAGSALKDALN